MSQNEYVVTQGILGNNVTDNSPVMQGLLAAYPYLTQGTNQPFYPNQMESIGNQLFMGFGSALNTPEEFQKRVQAPFTPFEGAPAAPTAPAAPAASPGQPTGQWAVRHGEGANAPWLSNGSIGANTPGARWFGTGNPYSDANVLGKHSLDG